jgi:hypothetical protein
MAVKKKVTSKAGGAAASTKAAPKKKAAAPKKVSKAPAVASGTTPKAGTPKTTPKAAAKKAAPVKLTSSQSELLKKVGSAAEPGYKVEKKAEQRTLDALHERKLIKRGAKDKASGSYHYQISNTGKKHIGSSNPTP